MPVVKLWRTGTFFTKISASKVRMYIMCNEFWSVSTQRFFWTKVTRTLWVRVVPGRLLRRIWKKKKAPSSKPLVAFWWSRPPTAWRQCMECNNAWLRMNWPLGQLSSFVFLQPDVHISHCRGRSIVPDDFTTQSTFTTAHLTSRVSCSYLIPRYHSESSPGHSFWL